MPGRTWILSLLALTLALTQSTTLAHFQELISSTDIVTQATGREVPVEAGALIWVRTQDMK
jgi:hypothetical protein